MILEGIVTTLNDDGSLNVAPMGPIVDERMQRLVLRPFRTSQTYANLKRRGHGVLHVVDDVWLLARAALGPIEPPPETFEAQNVEGRVLAEACRWYEFEVAEVDDREQRTTIDARVVASGKRRDFFGFNRAKHAVLEGAILATRVGILPRGEILDQFKRLAVLVEKTGGEQERRAWRLLERYVESAEAATGALTGRGVES